jgi:hypothetical protein
MGITKTLIKMVGITLVDQFKEDIGIKSKPLVSAMPPLSSEVDDNAEIINSKEIRIDGLSSWTLLCMTASSNK